MKLYEYISPTKVNMLYNQLQTTTMTEKTTEIDASLAVPLANVSSKMAAKEFSTIGVHEKIEVIQKEAERKLIVGDLKDHKTFVYDNKLLIPYLFSSVATWRGSFFERKTKVLYRYLMYGSKKNLQGSPDIPKRSIALCSSEIDVIYSLYEKCIHALDKGEEIDSAVKRRRRKDFFEQEYLNLKEWQVIEWLFHDNDDKVQKMDFSRPYEFFTRVDYRETILREYYDKFIHTYLGNLWENSESKVPEQTKAIVYICGSPIFIVKKPISKTVHRINDRSYLYLSKKEIQKMRSYFPNDYQFLKNICKTLSENGLEEEAQSMWGKIDGFRGKKMNEHELMKFLYQYVTDIKPL